MIDLVGEAIEKFGHVDAEWSHYLKRVLVGDPLVLRDAWLKWYEISPVEADISALAIGARHHLVGESNCGRLVLNNQLGFAEIHHRRSVAFLFVFTCNNCNELWKSLWFKDLTTDSPFERYVESTADHLPMACLWELTPIWHEREAWRRFVESPRDLAARKAWAMDCFEGLT